MTHRAVILARGLGTRMRRPDQGTELAPEQAAVAETGVKAMIPIGRPFLDYVLSALADAGYREVCLVIGPEHGAVREHYTERSRPTRVRVSFAVQEEPRGTADAVLAAESFAAGEPFLVINSDNYYPAPVLEAMRADEGAAAAGFQREALLREGNVPPERIAAFAVLEVAPDGTLARIVEKPDEATLRAMGNAPVSMNCWRFTPEIFEACRRIPLSARGELEIPDAVEHARRHLAVSFRVVPVRAGVLDLSGRADIPAVAERLREVEVRL